MWPTRTQHPAVRQAPTPRARGACKATTTSAAAHAAAFSIQRNKARPAAFQCDDRATPPRMKNRHFRRFVLFDFNKRPMKSCSVFLHTLKMMILSLYQVCTASIDELTKRQSRNIAHKAVFGLVLCHTCYAARFSLKHNEKPKSFLEHVSMIVVKLLLRLYAWN